MRTISSDISGDPRFRSALLADGSCRPGPERAVNRLHAAVLVFGPLQIVLVYNVLPTLWPDSYDGPELSEQVGTAVTYKASVCVNHLLIVWLSLQRLKRPQGARETGLGSSRPHAE